MSLDEHTLDPRSQVRRVYVQPELRLFGDVKDLTRGATLAGGKLDNMVSPLKT